MRIRTDQMTLILKTEGLMAELKQIGTYIGKNHRLNLFPPTEGSPKGVKTSVEVLVVIEASPGPDSGKGNHGFLFLCVLCFGTYKAKH